MVRWLFLVKMIAVLVSSVQPCVVDPRVPARLRAAADVQPLCAGYIDVTLPPYNASGDGMEDDSDALQAAVDDAYIASMTVFLPAGRVFLMSRQLLLLQKLCYAPCGYTRFHGMQIVGGGGGGGGGARPALLLADNSNVAGGIFVLFDAVGPDNVTVGDTASQYQSRLRGVDIRMGNNSNVSALTMSAAQLCSIEDTHISGEAFWAGLNGLPGSGGYSANVNVTGGVYGIVQDEYRPNPSVAGVRLVGQTKAGVLVRQSRGPVVLTGFFIESPPTPVPADWRAILLDAMLPAKDNAFAGEDGIIVVHAGSSSNGSIVIESAGCDVTLRNVYLAPLAGLGNATLFSAPRFGVVIPRGGPNGSNDPVWRSVARFVFTASSGSVWDAGTNVSAGQAVTAYLSPSPPPRTDAPNEALASSHTWIPDGPPTWANDGELLDVSTFCGATPEWVNSTDDDGVCIQSALDAVTNTSSSYYGAAIFLPHGEYGIYKPLELHGARLVGAGSHSSWLISLPVGIPGEGGPLTDAAACWDAGTSPLSAMLISSSYTSYSPFPLLSDFGLITRPLCPFIDLRAGANILWRDVCVASNVPPPTTGVPPSIVPGPPPMAPFISISGAASGRFFGLSLDLIFAGNNGSEPLPGPAHVLLLVNGTGGTGGSGGAVHLYQLSTEHKPIPKATLITGARDVHVHAWKSESVLYEPPTGGEGDTQSLLWVIDSVNITLFGHSGNFRMYNTTVGVVDVRGNSDTVELMAMTRTYSPAEPVNGTKWLRDESIGTTLDGHHQVLLYRKI